MMEFRDKVAVVTGGASGIGRALAECCSDEGMRVVVADIEQKALEETAAVLGTRGTNVLPLQTDVSCEADIQRLAYQTYETFGAVHLLFNNAGVAAGTSVWESTRADWEWVLGVNLWGTIHALREFVPRMLAQDCEGHIVNTASMAGLLCPYPNAVYSVSKHAVVALTEQLYHELRDQRAKVKVSVLCPGRIHTRILDSARNRPERYQGLNDPAQAQSDVANEAWNASMRLSIEQGLDPAQVADRVFEAIREERYYILIHTTDNNPHFKQRAENLLLGRNPRES